MTWQILTPIIGLSLAILGHAFATIWWAAKMTFTLEGIQREIKEIKVELKEEGVKQDAQIKALWGRQDDLRDRVLVLEQKGE